MTTATFMMLNPGRKIMIKPSFQKYFGFTQGRIIHLISTWERMATNGGTYTVERLDGDEYSRDLTPDIHRSCFVPVSPKMLERLKRREAKRKAAITS